MKRKKNYLAALLAIALAVGTLTGCGNQSGANAQAGNVNEQEGVTTIYAATSGNPRPFTFYDDNDELVGHNLEIIRAIFHKLPQYKLVIEVTDTPSIFAGIDSDKYHIGLNNFGMNEERKEKYLFTDPIFANAELIVANKSIDVSNIKTLEDLAGYTYYGGAGVNHTTIIENYNEANPDNQIEIAYTEADLNVQLQDIESGKYDFILIDKPMFFGYYQPEFEYDVVTADLEIEEANYSYLIVNPGNEQLTKDINEAFKKVIEEGISKEICERYFGDDYTP